jgi:hypothetical protein
VFGATSGQNSATISPSLVLITATSFELDSIGFLLSQLTVNAASDKIVSKIAIFVLEIISQRRLVL